MAVPGVPRNAFLASGCDFLPGSPRGFPRPSRDVPRRPPCRDRGAHTTAPSPCSRGSVTIVFAGRRPNVAQYTTPVLSSQAAGGSMGMDRNGEKSPAENQTDPFRPDAAARLPSRVFRRATRIAGPCHPGNSGTPRRDAFALRREKVEEKQRTPEPFGPGSSTLVDDTGIEPVTSSVSGKRSPAELIVRAGTASGRRDSNPRPSPWQGDALPLSHFRAISEVSLGDAFFTLADQTGCPCHPPEVETGFEPVYAALQAAASPLGHSTRIVRRQHTRCPPTNPSGRRDSNPRPSPWQGDALPLSHFRVLPGELPATRKTLSPSGPCPCNDERGPRRIGNRVRFLGRWNPRR